CCVASQAVIWGSVVMRVASSCGHIQYSGEYPLHFIEDRRRHGFNEGGAACPPVDALHLLDHHEALGRRIRQSDARALWPISPCDRASDHQPRGLIEFLVGQHQRRTVLCLLTPCLRLEIDPGEITAAGQVRQLRHYQTSLPTGRPQSTSPGWSSAVKPFSTSL